jgi:hypothetical protein
MIWKVLGLATVMAAVAIPSAAATQGWSGAAFTAGPAFVSQPTGVTVHRGQDFRSATFGGGDSRFHHGDRPRDRGRNRGSDVFLGDWGYYDPNFNRSWDSDSYNDWWHDRPDRAYPRWVQHNQDCDPDRMWQGGGVWRCGW